MEQANWLQVGVLTGVGFTKFLHALTRLLTSYREWTLMHLRKMKRMRLKMQMETLKMPSFCEVKLN